MRSMSGLRVSSIILRHSMATKAVDDPNSRSKGLQMRQIIS